MSYKEEIWRYLDKKKVKDPWKAKTDPTESYFLDKKGKRIARNINKSYIANNGISLLWKGWYTRLDRVALLVARLEDRANAFWLKVALPELKAALGRKTSVEVPYSVQRDGQEKIYAVSIDRRNEAPGSISYSAHNTFYNKNGQPVENITDLIQTDPGWADLFEGWEKGFPHGRRLLWLIQVGQSKWNRVYTARRILHWLIAKKLEHLTDKHNTGDIVEFTAGNTVFRFEKQDRRHVIRDDIWKAISSSQIQKVDISAIVPKSI